MEMVYTGIIRKPAIKPVSHMIRTILVVSVITLYGKFLKPFFLLYDIASLIFFFKFLKSEEGNLIGVTFAFVINIDSGLISLPIAFLFNLNDSITVDPPPRKGSSITSLCFVYSLRSLVTISGGNAAKYG